MPRKSVLITGVAGMIGSHLADLLVAQAEYGPIYGIDDLSVGTVDNIDHLVSAGELNFSQVSILDNDQLATLPQTDIIVHLAAAKKIGEGNPGVENLKTNGIGSENIFRLALDNNSKVIFGSTSDCYGMSPDLPFREDGDLLIGPSMIKRWSYAVGKLYAEQLAFAYHKDHGLPIVVLRYFGGFSERASFSWSGGHIPIFIDAALAGQPYPIHGDGSQTRSMTHVSNLVRGTFLAMESDDAIGQLINLGDTREISVLDSARIIHRLAETGNPFQIDSIPMSTIFGAYKDIQRRVPDLSKAEKILGYTPQATFEDGVKKVIESRRVHLQSQS